MYNIQSNNFFHLTKYPKEADVVTRQKLFRSILDEVNKRFFIYFSIIWSYSISFFTNPKFGLDIRVFTHSTVILF